MLQGRILGMDLGEKYIGLAISDALNITAQALETIERKGRLERFLNRLKQIIKDYRIQKIVVGLPRNMDGSLGKQAQKAIALARDFQIALDVEVEVWDERLSTQEVEAVLIQADLSRRRRKKVIDKLSAVLILQSYLDKSKSLKE